MTPKSLFFHKFWIFVDVAHGRALDQGLAISGRGKGGSLQLLVSDEALASEEDKVPVEGKPDGKELVLYEPAKNVIKEYWAKSEHYDEYIVGITAMRGIASTGGKWSRPRRAIPRCLQRRRATTGSLE